MQLEKEIIEKIRVQASVLVQTLRVKLTIPPSLLPSSQPLRNPSVLLQDQPPLIL